MTPRSVLSGFCLSLLTVSLAHGQSTEWSDRAFVNVNQAFQLQARPFTEQLVPLINAERALIVAPHAGSGGKLTLDVGGGVRVWKNIGAGGVYTMFSATETPMVDALIPHPTAFGQPRSASKAVPLERSETAIHVHGLYVLPVSSRLDVALSAGPSFINVQQGLVQRVDVAEAGPPFTTVAIGNVAVLTRDVSAVGVNVGADVTWFVTPLAGVGVTARYVRASASTQLSDGRPLDLNAGGFQIGMGARLRLR